MHHRFSFLSSNFHLFTLSFLCLSFTLSGIRTVQKTYPIETLACLDFYLRDQINKLTESKGSSNDEDDLSFSSADAENLWNSLLHANLDPAALQNAYDNCLNGQTALLEERKSDALSSLKRSVSTVSALRDAAIRDEQMAVDRARMRKKSDPFGKNPYIDSKTRERIKPYLIGNDHPMKPVLDRLFSARVTANRQTLEAANFKILDRRKRSFICVVSHPELPDYLLKLHFDSDKREKQHKASWVWFVKRCEGANKIQNIIDRHKIKYFICAKKWIYPLPASPSPPRHSDYTRHLTVLLVTDMHLAHSSDNYLAWKTKITTDHLDELYIILTRAKGSSYRPDNIALTRGNEVRPIFAFMDTEYPDKGPDFRSIRPHLNSKMREYWDGLVRRGSNR